MRCKNLSSNEGPESRFFQTDTREHDSSDVGELEIQTIVWVHKPNGYPVVSYLDSANIDLKVAEMLPDYSLQGFFAPVDNSVSGIALNSVHGGAPFKLPSDILG